MKVELKNGRITAQGLQHELQALSVQVPGVKGVPKGGVYVPMTAGALQELGLVVKRQDVTQEVHELLAARDVTTKRFREPSPSAIASLKKVCARDLMPHQLWAVAALQTRGGNAQLADDMGLGKSLVAIDYFLRTELASCTVFCPAFLKQNWVNEIQAACPDEPVCVIEGTPKKRADRLAIMHAHRFVVINYDILPYLSDEQIELLQKRNRDGMVICDESHYIKSRTAQRTQITFQLRSRRVNLLLTGTPIRNDAVDLYSQLRMIEPELWRNQWEFEGRYMHIQMVSYGFRMQRKVVGVKNPAELKRVVSCYQIRRLKNDVLNLPPKIESVVELEMDQASRSIYTKMKDWWLYEFADVPDNAPIFSPQAKSALESMLRLEQICQGFIGGVPPSMDAQLAKMAADGEVEAVREGEWIFPKATKVLWLSEQIEDFGIANRPLTIWFRFNAPLLWFHKKFAAKSVALHGGLADKAKGEAIDRFQLDPEKQLFFGQVAMGTGFNLVRAQDQIFYARDWSPFVNTQAADRLHRIGQKGTVNVYVPIIKASFEGYLHRKLIGKVNDADAVLHRTTMGELREALAAS